MGKKIRPFKFINSRKMNIRYENTKELDIFLSKDELVINEDMLIRSKERIFSDYVITNTFEKVSSRDLNYNKQFMAINIMPSRTKLILITNFMTFS